MTIYRIPTEVFDGLVGLSAIRAQAAGIEAERAAWADECLAAIKTASENWTLSQLREALRGFGAAYGTGWTKRAEAAGLPTTKQVEAQMLSRCNDGDGRWAGSAPLEEWAVRPASGMWVVYQLLLNEDLVYIGSTGSFATRLKAHARDKEFDSWRASRCASENDCRALEAALIDRYRPPLNRMIPKPKVALA